MSSNRSTGCSDVYAVVDLSKKKKKTTLADEKKGFDKSLNSDISLYSEISDVHQKTGQQNNTFFVSKEGLNDSFTSTANEEHNKKIIGSTGRCDDQLRKSIWDLLFTNKQRVAFFTVLFTVIGINFILFLIVFVKIDNFESSQRKYQQKLTQVSEKIDDLESSQREYQQELVTESDNINIIWNKLYEISSTDGTLLNPNVTSCADLYEFNSSSTSDYYTFRSSTGQLVSVYCDMTRTCGNITGGWMRVAKLDVYNCPSGLRSEAVNKVKTCIQSEKGFGCTPIFYSSYQMHFSKVCGGILGYGLGTLDGFNRTKQNAPLGNYLDGISVNVLNTVNGSHVWSFVAGNCNINHKPAFVGDDYTCTNSSCDEGEVCPNLLWNTTTGEEEAPFFKDLNISTTADVVMSLCRDESRNNEDIAIVSAELYVQ